MPTRRFPSFIRTILYDFDLLGVPKRIFDGVATYQDLPTWADCSRKSGQVPAVGRIQGKSLHSSGSRLRNQARWMRRKLGKLGFNSLASNSAYFLDRLSGCQGTKRFRAGQTRWVLYGSQQQQGHTETKIYPFGILAGGRELDSNHKRFWKFQDGGLSESVCHVLEPNGVGEKPEIRSSTVPAR